MKNNVCAVILAGGVGSRMGSDITKQRMTVCGRTVLSHTVSAFEDCDAISSIVVVARADELDFAMSECAPCKKVIAVVNGGNNRAESARNGFYAIPSDTEYVAVHDAARCLISPDAIARVVAAAVKHGAATAVATVNDTVKLVDAEEYVSETADRECVRLAATPQIFRTDIYRESLEIAERDGISVTDDNMLVEHAGYKIICVDTGKSNIKITHPEDLEYAELVLRRREKMPDLRIGHGYDVHKLVEGRALIVGGVEISHTLGLLGHSDADVLLHAIMDAIIGAMGLGDIGKHFPDTDEEYRGISSMKLLAHVCDMMRKRGYAVVNLDATVIAQRPKLSPYISEMRDNIAKTLGCDASAVNVKATTEERLGFTGREEGISAHAVALLERK